jgi:4-hydroxy-3-methylbut-2-enyl diphosphate reductase
VTVSLIFRKGLDVGPDVAAALRRDYHSRIVDQIKASDFRVQSGRLTIHLAREFGFCYGVDRAVDYAYQTRHKFPSRTVHLTGEIIHNPHVNARLRAAGLRFLTDEGASIDRLGPDDVVILPAFGVTVADLDRLEQRGCILVDTTCGSVLNVWKNVRQYARDGFTALIHGKVHHEETRATASQTLRFPTGKFLVILDREEADIVCAYVRCGGDRAAFLDRFAAAASPGFDPDRDLVRIGLANQTTMLMSESLAIGEMVRQAMIDRYGERDLARHYVAFDTICSATQDRQDAVEQLLAAHQFDFMLVIGGYNSSNTRNLARICARRVPTYHIADSSCLVSLADLRHQPIDPPAGSHMASQSAHYTELTEAGWLPPAGPVSVGLTAGASTPDNIVGQVVERLETFTKD